MYLVETKNNKYILRICHHHWRCREAIEFELELLDFLHKRHCKVAYPLKTKAGKLSIEINAPEGKRYAALFIYAPGVAVGKNLNITQSKKLGENSAYLHKNSSRVSQ
ncbi:phosphotransferase [Anaplasma marginale]|uniref:phosphotransferase n=1 Tax=Anaplasma marginale TaxID=770 RepID=UPI0034E00676